MNFSSSMKKLICFLLAVLMLFATVGCKDTTKKNKKKKVIKKKVIVIQEDNVIDNNQDNNIIDTTPDDDSDSDTPAETRPERKLPEVAQVAEKYVDPIVHEFDHEYKAYELSPNCVIIYGLTEWNGRYEGYENYGTSSQKLKAVEYTAENRIAANDLQVWIKDNYNINLNVYKDTVYAELVSDGTLSGNEKKILVGDSLYHTSKLADNQFAVTLSGNDVIFDGGHFAMVEKAVDWFRSVKIEDGKIATLSGTQDNFASQIELDGVTYDYVWGDEFDGYEFNDDDKWSQTSFGLGRQTDMANIYGDPRFQFVENGKLRLTGDRYYDEGDANIGYATSGQIDTDTHMLLRNGYIEFYARLPYTRGAFPALWSHTNDAQHQKFVPNYNVNDGFGIYSKRAWDIEFDLFEAFGLPDQMSTTIHKWYINGRGIVKTGSGTQDLTTEEQLLFEEHYNYQKENKLPTYTPLVKTDENGNTMYYYLDSDNNKVYVTAEQKDSMIAADESMADKIKVAYVRLPITLEFEDGSVDIFNYSSNPYGSMSSGYTTSAYNYSYRSVNSLKTDENGMYNWDYKFDAATINNEYHLYALKYTSKHLTVYMDGVPYLDFDWDPAYDYRDLNGDGKVEDISRNNNGVGFNLWHYFIVDMMIYTPTTDLVPYDRRLQPGDLPLNLYVDYMRCYQDLDDPSMAIYAPNLEE